MFNIFNTHTHTHTHTYIYLAAADQDARGPSADGIAFEEASRD